MRPHADGTRESGERPRFELELEHAQELAPDTVVAGKYRVRSVLGRGGFAVVYDAEHLGLGREVALKVLHRTDGTPHVLIERFLREVRISALVRHPNVLEVYDAGVHEDGSPFLAMEKIHGLTLHQRLAHQQRLSVDDTRKLSLQLLSALVAIGERGIVHRDVKPENLMLSFDPSGEVQLKLVDFGIALVHETASFAARLTQHGALVGTPHYMAPEQLRCELTDARADLYAAGVVMYQALTGVLPYDGADFPSLTVNVLNGKARALRALCPECPRALARVIERALEREPEHRFPDARSMLEALAASGAEASVRDSTRETLRSLVNRARRLKPRPPELMIAAATVGLMTIWTSHAEVAAALRATFADDASAAGEAAEQPAQAAVSVVPLPLAASAQPALPTPREPKASASVQEPAASAHPVEVPQPAAEISAKSSAPTPRARTQASEGGAEASARARTLLRKGLTLYLHAEVDAAYAVYRQAAQLAPNEPAAFRGLGLTASRLGRSYEAQRAFTRYLELAPLAPDARLIRARLAALYSEEAARGLRGGAG
jgi:serine/threonine-protein kinase